MLSFTRAQRFFDGAAVVQVARTLIVMHEVMKSGPSIAWITSKAVISCGSSTARSRRSSRHANAAGPLGQPLENLGQQLRRNVIGLGRCLSRSRRGSLGVLGQKLHRHQPIIRLFGEPQHRVDTTSTNYIPVYDQKCPISNQIRRVFRKPAERKSLSPTNDFMKKLFQISPAVGTI